jgi:hypothetical protein
VGPRLWARGFSEGQVGAGKIVNLTAVAAPTPRQAAQYYPAQYWLSLLQVPPKSDFPGTGAKGNGISENIKSQGEWIRQIINTDGCTACHQLGSKGTREIPESLGRFESSIAAWDRRIQSGQAGGGMSARFTQVGRQRALAMFADWTDRIAAGELPAVAPPRPQGVERNVVVTMWDWADPKAYLHDEISTDKRNPTVNANGPIYGSLEASADYLPVVDPMRHASSQVKLQVRDPKTPSEASDSAGGGIAVLERRRSSGRASRTPTASRWTSRAAYGSPHASVRIRRRPSVSKVRIIRPPRRFH